MTNNTRLTNQKSIDDAELHAWGRYIEQFHGLKPCPIEKEHEALMVVIRAYEQRRSQYSDDTK
jgi:hypothetical protein